ncbi:recombinase family protein [Peribacillus butanolivorans]|uniref:recombinase family protein n=1 Tax=Peribacillus butanolivorans TaxID=421767 RepID=UPI00207D04DF|nr:recombinase family protein [Peribacillus butanolivorans]MCO0601201.1 recombinase family protein [Peribacillus butanolivorans]
MLIGYARVSTTSQDLEKQKEILEKEGCEKLFVKKVTGTSTKQIAQLYEAIEFAREGDTLVVTEIDRLARSSFGLK